MQKMFCDVCNKEMINLSMINMTFPSGWIKNLPEKYQEQIHKSRSHRYKKSVIYLDICNYKCFLTFVEDLKNSSKQ